MPESPYFSVVTRLAEISLEIAELLSRDPEGTARMQKLAREAGTQWQSASERLAAEFITPLDREDFAELAQALLALCGSVADAARWSGVMAARKSRPTQREAMYSAEGAVRTVKDLARKLPEFKKPEGILAGISDVREAAAAGKSSAVSLVGSVCAESGSPLEITSWVVRAQSLQKICDACERFADVTERVILKNG